MEKLIKIQAESAHYGCEIVVPEKKAPKLLKQIREAYMYLSIRHTHIEDTGLKVKTIVYNPKLF